MGFLSLPILMPGRCGTKGSTGWYISMWFLIPQIKITRLVLHVNNQLCWLWSWQFAQFGSWLPEIIFLPWEVYNNCKGQWKAVNLVKDTWSHRVLWGSLKGKYALCTICTPSSVIAAGELGYTSSNGSPKESFFHQVHALDLQIRQWN